MKNFFLLFLLFTALSHSQTKYNLNFDQFEAQGDLPDDWIGWGDYGILKDSVEMVSGKYSARIESGADASSFGSIAYKIPANYKGKSLNLEGYIQTLHQLCYGID